MLTEEMDKERRKDKPAEKERREGKKKRKELLSRPLSLARLSLGVGGWGFLLYIFAV